MGRTFSEVAINDSYSTLESAQEKAAERGCKIVLPADNELFIDIDSEEDLTVFVRGLEMLQTVYACTFERTASPSGKPGRYHIIVNLGDVKLTDTVRVLLQACLGSDRVREMLSWLRILNGEPNPTLFFEKLT